MISIGYVPHWRALQPGPAWADRTDREAPHALAVDQDTYELLEILPRALEWLTFSNPTRPTLRKPAQQNPTSDGRFCPAGLQL